MPKCPLVAVLVLVGVGSAVSQAAAQHPVQVAFANSQPHFVAAWAPDKERAAERSAVLVRRVSLELTDASLDVALKTLTNRAGLRITYSLAVLPRDRRVTMSARDVAVVTALTEILFRSGLDVVVDRDGALALIRCRHRKVEGEAQDSGTIVGKVTSQGTGAPIVGASVVVEGGRGSTMTDTEGHYRIAGIDAGTYEVRARYIGYVPLAMSVTVPPGGEVTADFGLTKSVQKLDELVTVTPGGVQTQMKALPTPLSVIPSTDIADRRSQSLLDVFRQVVPTAVGFPNPGQAPLLSTFSARGVSSLSGSSLMKIYVDGIEATGFGASAVDPASVERLEISRGPQAATLFGADAAGGVVQIFTKRGDTSLSRPRADGQAQLGLAQTPYDGNGGVLRQSYSGSLRSGGGDFGYNLGGSYTHLADYVPGDGASSQSTPSVYGGMHFDRSVLTADLSARYYQNSLPFTLSPLLATTGFSFLSRPFYQNTDFTNETYGARIALSMASWWQHHFTVGADRLTNTAIQTRPRFTTPDDTLFTVSDFTSRKISLAYNSAVTATAGDALVGTLTAGVDHYETVTNNSFTSQALNTEGTIETAPAGAFTASREIITNTGFLAQLELGIRDAVFLTLGMRADDNSTFGAALGTPVSPRAGISIVRPVGSATVKLRGSYGRAIRAPAPGSAFGGNTPFSITLPNPRLGPEQQRGWDAGVDVIFGNHASLSVTGYNQVAKDLIAFVQVATSPLPTSQFQNLGRVTNGGVEVEGALRFSTLQLKGQYGFVSSRIEDLGPTPGAGDVQVGDRPLGLPRHTAGASLTWSHLPRTSLTAGLTYVGSFRQNDALALFRCFGGTGPCLPTARDYVVDYPGFAKINASVMHKVTRYVDAFMSMENLTNNEAYEGSNLNPVLGRVTTMGLHFSY